MRPSDVDILAGVAAAFLLSALGAVEACAQAPAKSVQPYPVKTIHIIVPYAPGGPTDILARTVGQRLAEVWGQPVVIENRAGAAGMTGTALAAKAPADGYTMATAGITFVTTASMGAKLSFDPERDFDPVTFLGSVPNIAVVHPSLPVKSIKELIAFGKARPGQLLYASGGAGGTQHLAGELFRHLTGLNLQHVPYRGSSPSLTAVVSGEVAMGFTDMLITVPHVRDGRLRGLAVTGVRRARVIPELPTVSEAGLPGYAVSAWFGLITPAGTPRDIIRRVQTEIARGLKQPETLERLSALGADISVSSPEEFGAFIKAEREKWARVIKAAGLRAE
ncbi:MAG TPA: tripartite tricarboxylate transporter substrate binding protein [Burkholderiales bacterium]|nr:tripartite tricarboxylate transporter substrate binding protein [Burkholderiales bacterium]